MQNKILVLFDNDVEGIFNHGRCTALNVPSNMRILRLPDVLEFASVNTTGPDGEGVGNINGRAAAIECYLDIGGGARVRWTSFNPRLEAYQGELEGKTRYARAFLEQRIREEGYDYTKMEQVLDALVEAAARSSNLAPGKVTQTT